MSLMIGSITLVVSEVLLVHLAVSSDNVAAIRLIFREDRVGNVIGEPLFIGGVPFGFVTFVTTGFRLTSPWLIIAYALVGLMILNALVGWGPIMNKLKEAIPLASKKVTVTPEVKAHPHPSKRRGRPLRVLEWQP